MAFSSSVVGELELGGDCRDRLFERVVRSDIRQRKLDFESEDVLEDLAKRYGVSVQAMTIRLSGLGFLPRS